MSAREPESCLQISGERRMTITIAAIAAASSKATNRDIMSAREKEAAAKQTFTFLAPLTNTQRLIIIHLKINQKIVTAGNLEILLTQLMVIKMLLLYCLYTI